MYKAASNRYDKMMYNRVGKSGLKLPQLSLGFWQNFGYEKDYEEVKEIVLKAFDRAENVREVKTVYNTLAESFTSKTRQQQIKESVGFASKAVGVAPKQQIVEGDSAVLRMQQLAGIIK